MIAVLVWLGIGLSTFTVTAIASGVILRRRQRALGDGVPRERCDNPDCDGCWPHGAPLPKATALPRKRGPVGALQDTRHALPAIERGALPGGEPEPEICDGCGVNIASGDRCECIPERRYSCLPGGGRARKRGGPGWATAVVPRETWPVCNVCGAAGDERCDAGLHS